MIFDYFKELILNNFGHNPTSEQQEVVEALTEFILQATNSDEASDKRNLSARDDEVFILRGYAGTGKTSLVSALVKTMEQLERRCVLMAPTGRAAKVFALYSGHEAFTIHKRIYRQKNIDDDTVFSMGYNTLKNALFIVDEASMISNDAPLSALTSNLSSLTSKYGTGRLLDDLIQFVYSAPGCRLILMGDTAQLPPVGNIHSPALQPNILAGYSLHVTCKTLTQVVRQRNLSGILQNATQLRGIISQNSPHSVFNVQWNKDVRNIPGNELVEVIGNCYHRYGIDDTIVVCRSNKRAHIYNMGIRNQILDREEELASGDMIMIVKNNYYWATIPSNSAESGESEGGTLSFIANGDITQVLRVRNERELYGFRFADCELRFPDYDDMERWDACPWDTSSFWAC